MARLRQVPRERREALRLLRAQPGWVTPREFAKLLWPQAFAVKRRVGLRATGKTTGLLVQRRAGAYLRLMLRRGWVDVHEDYFEKRLKFRLSAAGRELLEKHERARAKMREYLKEKR